MERPSQKGLTLIELMLSVAVIGLFVGLVSRLMTTGLREWFSGRTYTVMQQNARTSKDRISESLRRASLSSILIYRMDSGQPLLSEVSFIDADGNSRAYFQKGGQLIEGTWSLTSTAMVNQRVMIQSGLSRFTVYYPNVKNPQNLGFSIDLSTLPYADAAKPEEVLVGDQVELKNP